MNLSPLRTPLRLLGALSRAALGRLTAACGCTPHRRAERFTPDPALEALLEQMRFEADPLADDTVRRLFASGAGMDRVNELLARLIHQAPPPEALRDDAQDEAARAALEPYLAHCQTLPPWADRAVIGRAGALFAEHGMLAFSVLGCASLPVGYAAPEAARVLGFTQQLTEHAQRRLAETALFLIDVMSRGGLEPGGRGLQDIARVRLMHAAIRHLLLQPAPGPLGEGRRDFARVLAEASWDVRAHGQPIHQVVMSATILCFSFVALRSARRMGLHPPPEAEHAYLHAWNVVGWLMGVRDELLVPRPETYAGAEKLFKHIWHRFRARAPYAEGIQLTAALLRFLEDPLHDLPPPLPRLPRLVMRDLIGPDLTRILGVKLGFWDEVLLGLAVWGIRELDHLGDVVYERLPQSRLAAEFLFRRLVRALAGAPRGGARPPFQIPDHLAERWRVRPPSPRAEPVGP